MTITKGGKSGWSSSGVLLTAQGSGHGTETVARPQGAQVSLQVDFSETGPSEFTIAFDLAPIDNPQVFGGNPPVLPTKNIVYMAEALIEMSIAGNTVRRRVSIQSGVTIQGIAESMRVVAWDTTPIAGLYLIGSVNHPYMPNLRYQVSINVARGHRAYLPLPPTLLPPLGLVFFPQVSNQVNLTPSSYFPEAAGSPAFVVIPVPYDAGVIAASVTMGSDLAPLNDPNTGMQFLQAQWGTLLSSNPLNFNFNMAWYPAQYPTAWVPMPPGCDVLTLFMATVPATDLVVQVTYAIDG